MSPLSRIAAERRRQIEVEGYTTAHDDEHGAKELAAAGGCYAIFLGSKNYGSGFAQPVQWPWSPHEFKPTTPDRDLEKAGALIVAAMEALDRAEGVEPPAVDPDCPIVAILYTLDRERWDRAYLAKMVNAVSPGGRNGASFTYTNPERAAWAEALAAKLR